MLYTLSQKEYARDKSKAELCLRDGCLTKPIDGCLEKVDGFVDSCLPTLGEMDHVDCIYSLM
jgi:hypothetical protein